MATGAQSGDRLSSDNADGLSVLQAARCGSVEALGRLFASVHGHLLLAARKNFPRRFRGRYGASDIVQDVVAVGHADFHSFRGGSQAEFFGWMRAILSRTMIDRVRTEAATRRMPERPMARLSAVDSGDTAVTDAPCDRPVANAIRSEDAALVSAALDSLPADQRRAIWLRQWEGMSFAEIGVDMGRSEEAARKLWCRAFGRLEDELRRRAGDDAGRLC